MNDADDRAVLVDPDFLPLLEQVATAGARPPATSIVLGADTAGHVA